MQKIYSAPFSGRYSTIVKTFLLTIFSLFILNAKEVKAQAGNHLSYDGIDDYVTLGNDVVLGLSGDYTIEFWMTWNGGADFQRVFDFGTTGDPFGDPWMFFTPHTDGNTSRFAITLTGLSGFQYVDAAPIPSDGSWHHVALVQSGTTFTIYIDGQNPVSGTINIQPADMLSTTENWLGRSQFGTDAYFNGHIEEFRISNTARYSGLSFTPPTTEFSAGTANTVALYHFNEGLGTTTADETGNFNATLAASPSTPNWVLGSPLPIKLNSVSASLVNGSVDIKWSASLDRESEFVIERSSNGSNFTSVGSIKRNNGTNGFENFSFRDNKPLSGRSFYRLKCTEVGSPAFYSRMVGVLISTKEDFVVYPNPARGSFITVELAKEFTGNVEISLTSASGAIVYKQKIAATNRREFQINRTASIVPGTYVLEINSGGNKRTKTIIYQ